MCIVLCRLHVFLQNKIYFKYMESISTSNDEHENMLKTKRDIDEVQYRSRTSVEERTEK